MAKVSFCNIRVEDTALSEVTDLLGRRYGYKAQIFDSQTETLINNPENKDAFVKRKIRELIRAEISAQRRSELADVDDGIA